MRVAVISDTHLPRFGRSLPRTLLDAVAGARVDRVLHLGDWTSEVALAAVEAVGVPFDGVAGNNDPPELVARFGRVKVIELEGVRIGLTHGDLGPGRSTPERAARTFEGQSVGAILFGHSHVPLLEWQPWQSGPTGRVLLLNPGSPTDRRRQPQRSWALLEIKGGGITAEIRRLEAR